MPGPEIQLVGLAAPIRHSLQALAVLASDSQKTSDLASVARREGLPAAALAKDFQRLSRAGMVESRRGPGGGYRLTRSPSDISLASIIEALNGQNLRRGRCLLRERECASGSVCALHHAAVKADACMREALRSLTLADLAPDARRRS